MTAPRPCRHLSAAAKLYPGAWRQFDGFRQSRDDLGGWPDWCYCPLAGAYAIVSGGGQNRAPVHLMPDVGRLGALAAWRPTQGIYRFDPAVYESLITTPITGDIPSESLLYLPEWCVYIETPGMTDFGGDLFGSPGGPLHGFFAHLEHDANNQRQELRFLLDSENWLQPWMLHLGNWTLAESLANVSKTAALHGREIGLKLATPQADEISELARAFEPLLSLLLYLCQPEPDYAGSEKPANPQPKRTKTGWRLFPPDKARTWDVGVRMGAAIRQAQTQAEAPIGPRDTPNASPRPHLRRAHWHTFRHGKDRVETRVKWLPPIPVNMDLSDDAPTTVIRPVK